MVIGVGDRCGEERSWDEGGSREDNILIFIENIESKVMHFLK